jgi:glycosyltransferase involved in cell wall biosynthesis
MYIIHLGFSGFPTGNASVQRVRLTFRGLQATGINTVVINKISHHEKNTEKKTGRFEGVPYIHTAYFPYRPASFVARNFNKLSGYFGELFFLYKRRKKIDTAILYSNYFFELPYYWILSKIFGFKIVMQYVELFSSIPGRNAFFTKWNDRLIDQYFYKFCDGVIAISDFLVRHVQTKSPSLPLIKLPAICDFKQFDGIPPYKDKQQLPYLMYCGTIYYVEVIELIIDFFEKIKTTNAYKGNLVMIISGSHASNEERLNKKMTTSSYQQNITAKSNIPYRDLLSLYKGADVLLIPLRDTIQDNARFPHKIGEYTAAKRPILSTYTGELKQYFIDGESALLTNEYAVDAYAAKIATVISSKAEMDKMGEAGYSIGIANFDFINQGKLLSKFLTQF